MKHVKHSHVEMHASRSIQRHIALIFFFEESGNNWAVQRVAWLPKNETIKQSLLMYLSQYKENKFHVAYTICNTYTCTDEIVKLFSLNNSGDLGTFSRVYNGQQFASRYCFTLPQSSNDHADGMIAITSSSENHPVEKIPCNAMRHYTDDYIEKPSKARADRETKCDGCWLVIDGCGYIMKYCERVIGVGEKYYYKNNCQCKDGKIYCSRECCYPYTCGYCSRSTCKECHISNANDWCVFCQYLSDECECLAFNSDGDYVGAHDSDCHLYSEPLEESDSQ